MDFIWDGLAEGIVCENHHFGDEVVGPGNGMHFTHFVELNQLLGNFVHLTAFHFDENAGKARAKLLGRQRALGLRTLHIAIPTVATPVGKQDRYRPTPPNRRDHCGVQP